jgi:hypothetical protein
MSMRTRTRNWSMPTSTSMMRTTSIRTISHGTAVSRTCIRTGMRGWSTPTPTIRTCTTGIRTSAVRSPLKPRSKKMHIFLLLVLAAFSAQAQESITVLERREIPIETRVRPGAHQLQLTLAILDGSGWVPEHILAAVRESARILSQCGVIMENAELVRIGAPDRFRDFHTATSRELARAIPLRKPAIYFIADTRQRPAFDAEAIGRGNSRTRPELADTVWVTRGTRDLGIALAHELAHVVMDSGEHSAAPGNLMREDTRPENTNLTDAQCARLMATGLANNLVH